MGTRFEGTDGVSLETAKWVQVLRAEGHRCCFFGGTVSWAGDCAYVTPEADFRHPEIQDLNRDLFYNHSRSPESSARVARLKDHIKVHLQRFVQRFGIDILVAENALSLPMNLPLGLALTEFLAETPRLTIAHHHDFYWERRRFSRSAASDYIHAAFPPRLSCVHHVVINSFAAKQLALRTGASSTLIPNVMDFEAEAAPDMDRYARDMREQLGVAPDQYLVLQPTRVVPRKRIERAIELVRRLNEHATLVISHGTEDEGETYQQYLREYAELLGVRVIFASDRIDAGRGRTADGGKVYSLADVYAKADLVTYPSLIEGFGNAFLEAVYYRKPLLMSLYEIFFTDIQPQGFRVIGFDDFIDNATVDQARRALSDPAFSEEMVAHNYALGRRHYSFRVLEEKLHMLISQYTGSLW